MFEIGKFEGKRQRGQTYREHVVTLGVRFLSLLLLDVELAEEVERQHSVQVDDDTRQHERQDQLQQQTQSASSSSRLAIRHLG